MLRNLEEVFRLAKSKETKRLVIAASHETETLKAVVKAKSENRIEPILVGNKEKIENILGSLDQDISTYQIFDTKSNKESAEKSVELIKHGHADLLMKGYLDTSELLRAVVNKNNGIAKKNTISHVNLMEIEGYEKLVAMTDVAIVIEPTLDQKKDIIENAVEIFNKLNYSEPKVAVVCAIEKVSKKMPETLDARTLQELNQEGAINNCIVEGPISFDIAMDHNRALKKRYKGRIVGDSDILVMPNLVAGNLLSKGIGIFGKTKAVGFVVGAEVPIVLTSRGASATSKYNSILACIAAL